MNLLRYKKKGTMLTVNCKLQIIDSEPSPHPKVSRVRVWYAFLNDQVTKSR